MKPFIHQHASCIGRVTIGSNSSLWPGSVLRADLSTISLGDYSNIQDNSVVHCDMGHPVVIGHFVTVGHGSVIHGSHIDDLCLIGMKSVLLNGTRVGKGSIVAAGSVIRQDTVIPPFSLAVGNPAVVKPERYTDYLTVLESALIYYLLSRYYHNNTIPTSENIAKLYQRAKEEAILLNQKILEGEIPSSLANLDIPLSLDT